MNHRKVFQLKLPSRTLVLGERTLVMGVLNVTPDSFSDGGKFFTLKRAVDAALAMERAGADILDIGAESTRPGSAGISAARRIARLLPVLKRCADAPENSDFRGHAKGRRRGNRLGRRRAKS